jgi:sialate O-acetylesterase
MVLQRNSKVNIWGWASHGEKVEVKFINKFFRTVTDSKGNWEIVLSAMNAGGPYSMVVKGNNSITIENIMIGDVWFCSGQSNMVLTMERVKEQYPNDIANANFPEIRNFFIPTASNVTSINKDLPEGAPKQVRGPRLIPCQSIRE